MPARINTPRTRQQRRRLAAADFFRRQQLQRIRGAASIWTPARLFSAGQQGVWYEPKPEYLYQDSAGTEPVTADGQPVGLMLDRHLGLELGQELFSGDFSVFTQTEDGWAISPEKISCDGLDSSEFAIGSFLTGVPGYYEITFTIENYISGSLALSVSNGSEDSPRVSSNGTFTFRANDYAAPNDRFYFKSISFNGEITQLSVKEVLGNHVPQSTASYKPLYAITPDQLDFDEFDDVLPVSFPVDMGTDVTIGRAVPGVGGEILTGQTVGTSYDITQDMAALIIVNETPSADNLSKLQSYLDTMAGV